MLRALPGRLRDFLHVTLSPGPTLMESSLLETLLVIVVKRKRNDTLLIALKVTHTTGAYISLAKAWPMATPIFKVLEKYSHTKCLEEVGIFGR